MHPTLLGLSRHRAMFMALAELVHLGPAAVAVPSGPFAFAVPGRAAGVGADGFAHFLGRKRRRGSDGGCG